MRTRIQWFTVALALAVASCGEPEYPFVEDDTQDEYEWLTTASAVALSRFQRHSPELPSLLVISARRGPEEALAYCFIDCPPDSSWPDHDLAKGVAAILGGTIEGSERPHIRVSVLVPQEEPTGEKWITVFTLADKHSPVGVVERFWIEIKRNDAVFEATIMGATVTDRATGPPHSTHSRTISPSLQCPTPVLNDPWTEDEKRHYRGIYQDAIENLDMDDEENEERCIDYFNYTIDMISTEDMYWHSGPFRHDGTCADGAHSYWGDDGYGIINRNSESSILHEGVHHNKEGAHGLGSETDADWAEDNCPVN